MLPRGGRRVPACRSALGSSRWHRWQIQKPSRADAAGSQGERLPPQRVPRARPSQGLISQERRRPRSPQCGGDSATGTVPGGPASKVRIPKSGQGRPHYGRPRAPEAPRSSRTSLLVGVPVMSRTREDVVGASETEVPPAATLTPTSRARSQADHRCFGGRALGAPAAERGSARLSPCR